MLAAMTEAMAGFEERLTSGGPLADGPRLLAAEAVNDKLELTIGTNSTQVWRETYGAWSSLNPRCTFQTFTSSERRLGDVLTFYYWDKSHDKYQSRTCWTFDEQQQRQLSELLNSLPEGVPEYTFSVGSLSEDSLEPVREHLFDLVRYAGRYPGMMRMNKRTGVASCEATGNLTEGRRELIHRLVGREGIIAPDDLVIAPGRLSRKV